jgi:hypothetical protein
MVMTIGRPGMSSHLSGIVDAMGETLSPARQGAQVGHAHAIGARDEGVERRANGRVRPSDHLSSSVDAMGDTERAAEGAEVSHAGAMSLYILQPNVQDYINSINAGVSPL